MKKIINVQNKCKVKSIDDLLIHRSFDEHKNQLLEKQLGKKVLKKPFEV
jgi:hypothetical protein